MGESVSSDFSADAEFTISGLAEKREEEGTIRWREASFAVVRSSLKCEREKKRGEERGLSVLCVLLTDAGFPPSSQTEKMEMGNPPAPTSADHFSFRSFAITGDVLKVNQHKFELL